MTLVAGIDSSTQSCKVIVRDLETGRVVRKGRAPHPPGAAVDPTVWWNALLTAVQDAGGLHDVEAISVAAQQHAMVCLDDQGHVLRDALLWNDTGSAPQVVDLKRELGADEWVRRTGLPLAVSYTATKLRWLRDNEPENARRTAAVVLPHDYLTWRLKTSSSDVADLQHLTTDRSDASGTAYWSGETESYCEDLFELALGRRSVLPEVLGPTASAGCTRRGIPGVAPGIRIGVGGGDNAVAALALGLDLGDAVMSLGTSGTVYARTNNPVHDSKGVVASYADATGKHLPLVCTLNAARDLDAAAKMLRCTHDELDMLALEAPPGAMGLTVLPYFEGERTPDLPSARASVHGLSLANCTPGNFARAMVEAMLCGQLVGLDAMRALDVPVHRLLVIGGGSRSRAVQHILPQLLNVPVLLPAPGEYVAEGAAMQAGAALTGAFPRWAKYVQELPVFQARPEIMVQHEVAKKALGYL